MEAYGADGSLPDKARIHNVAIPFCVVHALDDPLVTWRTVAANQGLMHPTNLTAQVKTGNLMILLTKAGGHVGWPLGLLPFLDKWKWMNDVAMTFVQAVETVKHSNNPQCVNSEDMTCTASEAVANEEAASDDQKGESSLQGERDDSDNAAADGTGDLQDGEATTG